MWERKSALQMECESIAISKPATNRSSNASLSTDIRAHPGAIATTLRLASSAAASDTAYPTAQFAAEQKRFAHGLRKISQRLEAVDSGSRLHFLGFDIDPLPGGGYEDLAEILGSMPADAKIDQIRKALQRVEGETIDDEIARLDGALRLIEAGRFDALRYSATCLRDSFDYVRMTYPAKTFDALNPGMAFRERYMHRQVERRLGQMRAE